MRKPARKWAVLLPAVLSIAGASLIAQRVARRVRGGLRPPRQAVGAPNGLDAVRKVQFVASDGIALQGWYVPSRNRAAIVLGHGWGGERDQLLPEAASLASSGYGVLLFDWRGHGESGGTGTTWGVDEQRDLDAAVTFLRTRPDVDSLRIGGIGFSMGGMILATVASRDPRVRAVVLEGAFSSLEDEMRHDEGKWGWWSGSVAVWTLKRAGVAIDRVRPIDHLCRISPRPLFVIVGSRDRDLPVDVARRMFEAACEPKSLWIIPGATHRSYANVAGLEFGRRLVAFFDQALLPTRATTDSVRPR
jgi:dipeptidyl aminopeptidase/acylaminoacyl peptidase